MTKFADRFVIPFPKARWGNRFGVHDIVDGRDLYGPQGHRGTDFVVPVGTTIPACGNGEVTHVMHSNALGNIVVVRHYLPGDNNDVYTGSCHLSNSLVRVGQTVALGQAIAKSGNTGTASTGPHYHLTMSLEDMGVIEGKVFDPIEFMLNFKAPAATNFQPKYTVARKNEGLIAIASRSKITFERIKQLNPKITAPDYLVLLDQRVRIA